ncbi:alcohol dehydrogenase catalytic domain-containing protein [Acerihabitans arboris]|uniref:Alcohol dehydrogenase catalytic domain-containing protein n=1 Tax=Acerihabitans arboris TaxID=2691583 RepID=A0A845SK72_9GAMM|nr:alcohol dehydrogenase catalytic domain-containing protein [Acerihabitans arboris]NDL63396.1 alcohol dehydrogenase catalytic domain-containing protein [Acerihabitans arboris]
MSNQCVNTVAVLLEPGKFSFASHQLEEDILPGYVRIKISYCGVCGTDKSFYLGHRNEGYPISLGHEHCGVIKAIGAGVINLQAGCQVVIDPNFRCGQCHFCRQKKGHLCINGGEQHYSNRGFAGYIDIHHSYVHKLPAYRNDHIGALVEPLSVALHALALSNLSDRKGEILVLGCGGLGTLLAFALLETTAADLYIHDHNEFKTDHIRSLYPDRIRTPKAGQRFDLIFEATGAAGGFMLACDLLEKCSRLMLLSRYHADEPFIPERLPWKQPEITLCHLNGDIINMTDAALLLADNWSAQHDNLLSFHSFEDINNVFANYGKIKSNKKIITHEQL